MHLGFGIWFRHILCLLVFFAGKDLQSGTPSQQQAYHSLLKDLPKGKCRDRLKGMTEFQLLLGLDSFRKAFSKSGPGSKDARAELERDLNNWSSDLLLMLVLQIEREYLSVCPPVQSLLSVERLAQKAYLTKLGWKGSDLPADIELAFKGLVTLSDDLPTLSQRIKAMPPNLSPRKLLEFIYGTADIFKGVVVTGLTEQEFTNLKAIVQKVCGHKEVCPAWDMHLLQKVAGLKEDGIAAFIPEIGVMVLSKSLLSEKKSSSETIVLHELAHVADSYAWHWHRQKWSDDFAALSGWTKGEDGALKLEVETYPEARSDKLLEEFQTGAFAFLPDPILKSLATGEGFVTARSYRESKERKDWTEDFADHFAVFFTVPERFCLSKKAFAPKKYEWLRKKLGKGKPLSCK